MPSRTQNAKDALLAKQNPEANSDMLCRLNQVQLQLWRDMGPNGRSLADLERIRPNLNIIEEVRCLQSWGLLLLEEPPQETSELPPNSLQTRQMPGPQKAIKPSFVAAPDSPGGSPLPNPSSAETALLELRLYL